MPTVEEQRQKQLENNIPEIWTYNTILYIGACVKRFHFKDALKNSGARVDVVEIDAARAVALKAKFGWLNSVYVADVRDMSDLNLSTYDLVFWSHGPEMIPREDVDSAVSSLFDLTDKLLVLMCPWGNYHYKKTFKSKYMNMTALYEEDFKGFSTSTLGDKNTNGSNLLSWRYK